jgi:glycosyltransferase involved in cell wall biosynthesis
VSTGKRVTVLTLLSSADPEEDFPNWQVLKLRNSFKPFRAVIIIYKVVSLLKSHDQVFANGLIEETGLALLISRKRGIAKIVGDPVWERAINQKKTQHSLNEFNQLKLNFRQSFQRKLLVFSLNRFQAVVTPSAELSRLIINWGVPEQKVQIIPNGVKCQEESDLPRDIDILTVSRLVTWKNVDLVVKAVASKGLSLTVIGDGPAQRDLIALTAELGADIKFLGELPKGDVEHHMKRAKLFVLYSAYEGQSFALLEAMSFGAVPVVSSCEGNRFIRHQLDGIVVEESDYLRLGEKLQNALDNNQELVQFRENGRQRVTKDFCLTVLLDKVIKALETP